MNLPESIVVTDQAALRRCVEQCSGVDAIAVDTEFMRTDTFYPILGLIQISDGESVWLIDPLALDDFIPLAELFENPDVVKVFHSCSEDLEVLRHQLGLVPSPLFDTQVAAAFLGHGFSRGYSALVKEVIDIQLEKHETRSDWLKRPLSESQLVYAAEDVYFLIKVYDHLVAQLQDKGRLAWMQEEMAELLSSAQAPEDVEQYYSRVKGAWRLSREELAYLQKLTAWREQQARILNRPRNRVLSDKVLLDIVAARPDAPAQLKRIDGLHFGQVKRFGQALVDLMAEDVDALAVDPLPEPLSRPQRQRLAELREIVEQAAGKLDIAPEILARKRDLEAIVNSGDLPASLATGWRAEVLGSQLG